MYQLFWISLISISVLHYMQRYTFLYPYLRYADNLQSNLGYRTKVLMYMNLQKVGLRFCISIVNPVYLYKNLLCLNF